MECFQGMLDNPWHSNNYWAHAVSGAVNPKNCTPTQSVVGKTRYKVSHGSQKKPFLKDLHAFECFAFMHIPKQKNKKLDYRATHGIFVWYTILTQHYIVNDPFAKMHHRSQDMAFGEGTRYTALNAAKNVNSNKHFNRDVIEEPNPQESSQPDRTVPNVNRGSHWMTVHLQILRSQWRSDEHLLALRRHLKRQESRCPEVVAETAFGRIGSQSLHNWLSKIENWMMQFPSVQQL